MLKKIVLAILVALPLSTFAQKFGVVDLEAVFSAMPESTAMQTQLQENITNNPIATPILLALVWGAGFGGFGSPLGGASNLVAISYLEKLTGQEFMYVDWIIRFLPLLFIILLFILAFLLRLPMPIAHLEGGKEYFRSVYAELGPMKKGEKLGLWLFALATVLRSEEHTSELQSRI